MKRKLAFITTLAMLVTLVAYAPVAASVTSITPTHIQNPSDGD